MPERAYRLLPRGPLHVGTWGIGQEQTLSYVPSDTLFGALVVAWAALDPDTVSGLLRPYLDDGEALPFCLTSAFPFAGPVRLFPRPQRHVEGSGDVVKRIKRADWVSEALFRLLCDGETPVEHLDEAVNFVQGGAVWITRGEREAIAGALGLPDDPDDPDVDLHLWSSATVPRVAVDRQTSASNLFHSGRLAFADGCGLWLAGRGPDLSRLESGLSYLQDAGLGGLRSTGHGAFEWQAWTDATPLAEPADGGYFCTLSRYAPIPAEFDRVLCASGAAFRLDMVAGWCLDDAAKSWRRKRVRLVGEGAVLGWPGSVPGCLVDVTPDHVGTFAGGRRVYRYGLAFPVAAV